MISYVLVGIAVLICIYFYMQKSKKNVVEYMGNILQEPFILSESFSGAKEGYVFKNDATGLGYYLDN